jgi:hypothetical protein
MILMEKFNRHLHTFAEFLSKVFNGHSLRARKNTVILLGLITAALAISLMFGNVDGKPDFLQHTRDTIQMPLKIQQHDSTQTN